MAGEIVYNDAREAETETAVETTSVPESPFCKLLRSKKFFMLEGAMATDGSQYLDSSNHCWCFQTQRVLGPDGGKVHPQRCAPGRGCYQSAFARTA